MPIEHLFRRFGGSVGEEDRVVEVRVAGGPGRSAGVLDAFEIGLRHRSSNFGKR